MKYILNAQVYNPYRSKKPRGFYHQIKGHTGVDLAYIFEKLPSPISGKVDKILKQNEMGDVIYIKDKEQGNIHVFAHMSKIDVKVGQEINRNDVLGVTGNSGKKTTAPHLHYEVITFAKPTKLTERIMTRSLAGYNGWNIDPLLYIRELYGKYNLNPKGEKVI